jgi:hypothetical protein
LAEGPDRGERTRADQRGSLPSGLFASVRAACLRLWAWLGDLDHLGFQVVWRVDVEAKRRPKCGNPGDGLWLEFEVAVRSFHMHNTPELSLEPLLSNHVSKLVGPRLEMIKQPAQMVLKMIVRPRAGIVGLEGPSARPIRPRGSHVRARRQAPPVVVALSATADPRLRVRFLTARVTVRPGAADTSIKTR